jgi:hypothetical protein
MIRFDNFTYLSNPLKKNKNKKEGNIAKKNEAISSIWLEIEKEKGGATMYKKLF